MPIPHLREPNFRIRKIGARVVSTIRTQRHHQKRWRRIVVRLLPYLGALFVLGVIGVVILFAIVSRDLPDPNKVIDRTVAQSTKIYARDGTTLLYDVHGEEKRTVIPLEQIPDSVKQATIAIEDKNFYTNHGFSLTGIIKAGCHQVIGNFAHLCPPRGGSTITQQFVKNAILTSEHTYTRKIKELILSYQLDRKFSKDQILQLYLNEIPYGSNAYGIESAAETYFGTSAKNLTLAQSAMLAAMVQSPSYYSPWGNHTDILVGRQQYVLSLMVEQGYITQAQADEAKAEDILAQVKPQSNSLIAPHFVMYVRELMAEKYGEVEVEQGGLKIITTLNIDKQNVAEEVVAKYADKNATKYNASNAALVSLDTKTGQILAMVGSKDYYDESIDGNVNVVLRPRQPGSSFKPIVYATAFQEGYTPETILYDLVTTFKTDTGPDYVPHNYDLKEHGPVSMRQALAGSLNIPAVKTLYLAGINNVLDTAEKLGYTTLSDRSRFGLSLVLGGGDVTLLEHTAAYATFAREGVYHPPVAILRVEDSKGKVLEQYEERETRVMDPKVIRLLNSVLSDNGARAYIFGEKNYLTLPDRPVAAKTGTTNDYRDAWTMGYTPSIATGVWVGNNDFSEMKRGADGSIVAAPIWNEFMKRTVGGPAEPFKAPDANSATKPILQGKTGNEIPYSVDSVTGKLIPESCLATYPKEFIAKKTFKVVHSELYYINKDDPTGPAPSDPSKDPEYTYWETPVQAWAKANNYVDTVPAYESCDLRSAANAPVVAFVTPESNATVGSSTFTIQATATGPQPIKSIAYYIDDIQVGISDVAPFAFTYTATDLVSGFHDIKAVVTDAIGNTGSGTITVNYLPTEAAPATP